MQSSPDDEEEHPEGPPGGVYDGSGMSDSPGKLISLDALDIALGGQTVCHVPPWTLRQGERWWVRGPNGAGKSSLLRVLAGALWPAPGQHERRRYHLEEEVTWSPMAAKGKIALLNPDRQNRYLHQDWDLSAAEVVATGFLDTDLLHQRPRPEECDRLSAVMKQLDVHALWERPFLELSQGERRRVLIARALATDPAVLLLDEFAEGLDHASREALWKTLDSLAKSGKAVVLTTHRPEPVLETEGWQTLDVRPARPIPSEKAAASRLPGNWKRDAILFQARGDLYLEGQRLIRDLEWVLHEGEHAVVLGPNGCGKSSFMRLVWGELHLAHGGQVVHFQDADLTVHQIRRQVSYFQPDMHAWFRPERDAEEVILSGLFSTIDLFNPVTDGQRDQVRAVAETFRASAFLDRPFGTLSYGQARRVLLARALVARPRIALLDEPFDGLDREVQEQLFEVLETYIQSKETTFILTSHHAEDRPAWIRQRLYIRLDRTLEKARD